MKNLITILLAFPFFALSQSFEVVDSPAYYYITVDSDTISQRYTKESKAILKAAELSLTNDNVVLLRPSANFTFNGDIAVDLSDYYNKKEIDSIIQIETKVDLKQSIEINKLKEELKYLKIRTDKIIAIIETRLKNKG
jgi:hypothetical protein